MRIKKYLRYTSFFSASLLFALFMTAPSAFAAGYTWTNVTQSTAESGQRWYSVDMSSDGKYQAASAINGFIYTSSDYGATWNKVSSPGAGVDGSVAVSSSGQYMYTLFVGGDIYKSSDYGASWTNMTQSSSAHGLNWISVSSSASGQFVAAASQGGDIWRSNDYGATWTDVTSGLGSKLWGTVNMSGTGQYIAGVTVSSGDLYVSNDYGANWTDVSSIGAHDWSDVTVSDNGKYMAADVWIGNVYVSSDYGQTWTPELTGLGNRTWAGIASTSSGQTMMAGISNSDLYISNDYGQTWADATSSSAISGSFWTAIATSSTGEYVTAGNDGSDIWTGFDPTLAPVAPSTPAGGNSSGDPAGSSITKAPDTGYGAPAVHDPILLLSVASSITFASGLGLLRLRKIKNN